MLLATFSAVSAASQNMATLAATRFLAGAFGSSPLTNGGGILADMFPASQRGMANSLYAAAPFLGPVIGPIGEYEQSQLTWKLMLCSGWICWPNHWLALDTRRHCHLHRSRWDSVRRDGARDVFTCPPPQASREAVPDHLENVQEQSGS